MAAIHLGIDVLLENPAALRDARVALLANHASTTRDGTRTVDALREVCNLVRLFAPEHGFWGDVAYLEDVNADEYHGIRIESLYGTSSQASLAPSIEQLGDIDVLLVDLQDVGSRYYTYAATMGNCMAAAALTRTRVVVLDRPNPINGRAVEGNVVFTRPFMSFVGQYPLPIRHGLTIGELAAYINAMQQPACDLEVVPMRGWNRAMWWDETGLDWIHPSPNMVTEATALVYPGTCLFEGTNISEGRGTTHPFELIGAPWLDEHRLAAMMNVLGLEGVEFQPFCFRPEFNKHKGERCRGVRIRVTDRDAFRPVNTAMLLLKVIHDLDPARFAWYDGFYEFATVLAIDALSGSGDFRTIVERDTLAELADWIATAELRRQLIEPQRQRAQIAAYDNAPRANVTPISRGAADIAAIVEIPRAEA